MKEVETLVRLKADVHSVLSVLQNTYGVSFTELSKTHDTYYYDPLRQTLKPNDLGELTASFRIRVKNAEKRYIAYKVDHFEKNGKWLYSDEYETSVGDEETISQIIKNLGLVELVIVICNKYIFENDWLLVVAEEVEGLGVFLEVEAKKLIEDDVLKTKDKIQSFILSLGLEFDNDFNGGKPELLIQKQHKDGAATTRNN